MMVRRGTAVVHAGGGVTLLSDPAAEYAESLDKVRAPLAALGAAP
jgi:anthranilate/para-aminobenzoate synthase component I